MSMFDKSEFIRDVFEAKFTSTQGDDFTSMLNLFSSDTEWEEVSSKDVRFLPVSEVDGISEAAMKDIVFFYGKHTAKATTLSMAESYILFAPLCLRL